MKTIIKGIAIVGACVFFSSSLSAQIWGISGSQFQLSTTAGTIGTQTNHSLSFLTNNTNRMYVDANGKVGFGVVQNKRMMHIHGTTPILAEMDSQIPPPPGTESMLVITNTESGSTAWDGLRLGLQGSVAQLGTVDKLRMDIYNGTSLLSFKGDGKITMFTSAFNYDAKFAIRSTADNAMYIDNTNNNQANGYALKIAVSNASTSAYSVVQGLNTRYAVFGDGRMALGQGTVQSGFVLDVNGRSKSNGYNSIASTDNVQAFSVLNTSNNLVKFVVQGNGKVGIGTDAPGTDYMLDVVGKARACEVRVNNPGWCDYVFEENYNLMPLSELKEFLATNKHLPEMPSEKVILDQGGFDVAAMNVALLKRSEENTLYILELESKINQLSQLLEKQGELIESLTSKK